MSTTLKNLMTGAQGSKPYDKAIKVAVVAKGNVQCFSNDNGEERRCLNVSLADSTMAVKAVIYDKEKFHRFVEGKSVMIRQAVRRNDGVLITNESKVYPSQHIDVPDYLKTEAENLIRPPPAQVKPLKEALRSPVRTRVSVQGKIVQEEAAQEVMVKHSKVKVKTIQLQDATSKAKISLWRDCTEAQVRPGDYVTITNVVVNQFRNEVSFNSTTLTSIQVTEAPEETNTVDVIAVCVENLNVNVLLADSSDINIPLDIFEAALPQVEDIEKYVTDLCDPVLNMEIKYRGGDVTGVSFKEI